MDYDIGKAFAAIEEELIASMMRNMKKHREWETDEGFQWSMWQAEQLKALAKYKRANKKKFERQFNEINGSIRMLIEQARAEGGMEQELEILEAIEKGWKPPKMPQNHMDISGEFFKLNTRKLEALIKATENDFQRAETAMLRMANDQYRQVIFNAQVYANTGAGTYEKAVDMATKDFLSRGINCIEYSNGARHTMRDYAEMAIRTAAKRAYLTGEGEKRQEWGIDTVIVHKRGNPCPKCLPFVGKVLIDDVWSGGSSAEGQKYPLMSTAVEAGLYHPRCKDTHSTYFPGISEEPDDVFTEDEIAEVEEQYREEQRQNHIERQIEKYQMLENNALDEENKEKYRNTKERWMSKASLELAANDLDGKIIPVNSKATFQVELPSYGKEQNTAISKACKEVVTLGDELSAEVLHLIDLDTCRVAYTEIGGDGNVGGPEFFDFLDNNPGRYAFVHNHPDGDSLSKTDAITLLLNKNIEVMVGAGNNGKIFTGIRPDSVDIKFFEEYNECEKIIKDKHKDKYELTKDGTLPYFEYSRIIERETCIEMVRKFGIYHVEET